MFSLMVTMAVTVASWMAACGGPGPGTGGTGGTQTTTTSTQAACPATIENPCMRYTFTLDGNPSTDVVSRNKYIAAFGDACYMSEANTFGCFYKKPQARATMP
jgi:hypothetical protein